MAARHQHAPLLGAAQGGRGLGQRADVVQQAARLCVGRVAVGVTVLLLDVPAQFPALPFLQDLRLNLFVNEAVQNGHQQTLKRGKEQVHKQLGEPQRDGAGRGLVSDKYEEHLMDSQQRDEGERGLGQPEFVIRIPHLMRSQF